MRKLVEEFIKQPTSWNNWGITISGVCKFVTVSSPQLATPPPHPTLPHPSPSPATTIYTLTIARLGKLVSYHVSPVTRHPTHYFDEISLVRSYNVHVHAHVQVNINVACTCIYMYSVHVCMVVTVQYIVFQPMVHVP